MKTLLILEDLKVMEITYKDKGEFLRGFLILIKKDKSIDIFERNMAIIIGQYFGFEIKFCEETLDTLLENKYISEEPPLFSNKIIAEYFVRESHRIVSQIHSLDNKERNWLQAVAIKNNINISTFPHFKPDSDKI